MDLGASGLRAFFWGLGVRRFWAPGDLAAGSLVSGDLILHASRVQGCLFMVLRLWGFRLWASKL